MRQLLYVSSKSPRHDVSIGNILVASRRNNDAAHITGLLYTDGARFLQVLEGPGVSVATTFERIKADPRHHAALILADRSIDEREFGNWAMAHRQPVDAINSFDDRLLRLLSGASPSVRGTFMGLVAARRAA